MVATRWAVAALRGCGSRPCTRQAPFAHEPWNQVGERACLGSALPDLPEVRAPFGPDLVPRLLLS